MPAAGALIAEARRHLVSAAKIADDDPVLGISACHAAARKAITAHMRAGSHRPTNEAGSHKLVIDYAATMLQGVLEANDVNDLNYLR